MADTNNNQRPPRCVHLTCKSMMVYGEDFQDDPEVQEGLVDFECLKTFRLIGPDDGEATLELCSDPKRGCYQEY